MGRSSDSDSQTQGRRDWRGSSEARRALVMLSRRRPHVLPDCETASRPFSRVCTRPVGLALYNAQSYCMSMYYGADWPDEGNICARGGGDKG